MAQRRSNRALRPQRDTRPSDLWRQIVTGFDFDREQVRVGHDEDGVFISSKMESIFGTSEAIYGFKTKEPFLVKDAKIEVTISDFLSDGELDDVESNLVAGMQALGHGITCNESFTVFSDQFDREHNCLEVTVPANANAIKTFIHAVVDFEGEYHTQETDEPSADGGAAATATPAQVLSTKPLTKLELAKRELEQLADAEARVNADLAAAERQVKEAEEAARLEAEQAAELAKTRAEIDARKKAMSEKQAKLDALKSAKEAKLTETWHTPKNAVKLEESTPTPTPEGAFSKNSFAVLDVESQQGASWADAK
jgi:hypothetical protein